MNLDLTTEEVRLLIAAATVGVHNLERGDKAHVRVLLQRIREEVTQHEEVIDSGVD
jgi:hypothetical protein